MAQYLIQASYTSDTLAAFVKTPQDRTSVVARAIETLGGSLVGGGMCFGDYDIAIIANLPDNTAAAAFAFAIGAGGACTRFKTTPILSVEEMTAAMKTAGTLGYRPPSA
jgi:uncharacterized protein with GYD domain